VVQVQKVQAVEALAGDCPQHDAACRRAAWLYLVTLMDPCGLASRPRITRAEREHYARLVRKFGRPECDLAALIRRAAGRLKILALLPGGDVIERAASYARILRASGTTYRVAAAAGLVAAARETGTRVILRDAALAFRCTEPAVRAALRRLRFIQALRSR